MKISIEAGAAAGLAAYCAGDDDPGLAAAGGAVRLVADANTWTALGADAFDALEESGIETRTTVYGENAPVADGESVLRLLADCRPDEKRLVAVGSGTITDIVRFVAFKTARSFISLPTAPSVDAYASSISALVLGGTKVTLPATTPEAIFADPAVLAGAPEPMIAAGFADVFCKFSAVADWRLGALVWDEPFDGAIAERALASARGAVACVDAIRSREGSGMRVLIGSLIESGSCTAQAGHSRPASGAEHQYSHFWEMALLRSRRPPILHGLKVGIGTVIAAGFWDGLKSMSRAQAARLLAEAALPNPAAEIAAVRAAYGEQAETVLRSQQRFLALDSRAWSALKDRILAGWDRILAIAAEVPGAAETRGLLLRAGCPIDPRALGLGEDDIALALSSSHYLRDRFTVRKLSRMLLGA